MSFLTFTTQPVMAAETTSWIRGVNLPAIWYDSQSYSALTDIANAGFNTVRIVWQTDGSASRLNDFLNKCDNLSLKPIVELHDFTGGTSSSDISTAVDYWLRSDVFSVIQNHPSVWINIANEWGPSGSTVWRDAYINAVTRLRNAGYGGAIVIDSGGWGQDANDILWYAWDIINADPNQNTIFTIHMYGSWNNNSDIANFLGQCIDWNIPIIIGEFGYNYNNGDNNLGSQVDAAYLIQYCKDNSIGFIPWSWSGNNSENAWLDMTTDFGSYTWWGNFIVDNMW
ncbi:cellulase family glycosylhydrolase [Orenia metallireducens]|uniref:cellulase family glycosylhydrolase n=1 Tax=Orenia metallireducens TaxID=1413210 RepID=UPI00159F26FA|nr:cellulase family glycosylhydrolase [Orenia metallireducens]